MNMIELSAFLDGMKTERKMEMEKINKRGRSRLTDDEFNALSRLTAAIKLDENGFDVFELENEDCFIDYDGDLTDGFDYVEYKEGSKLISLYNGLCVIDDCVETSYPLQYVGLTEKEARLICDLFLEFNITDDEKYIEWLMSKEDI